MKKILKWFLYIILIVLMSFMALILTGNKHVLNPVFKAFHVPGEEQAVQKIYETMMNGDKYADVLYIGRPADVRKFADSLVNKAFEIDDKSTSDDFDYMFHKFRSYKASASGFMVYSISYTFEYSETGYQTEAVNKEVDKILKSLKLSKDSDYKKVKKIHDYIIKNISYDLTVNCNSAYEGLMNGVTACQGYANLAYKMLTEAGVNARVIGGVSAGEGHAWNIVEIDNLWYNLDCTWDDPSVSGIYNYEYNYFLKGERDFADHMRDAKYNTSKFNEIYKMSDKNYVMK